MLEGERRIHIFVPHLFKRQFDVATHRTAAVFESATVGRFHNTRSAARKCGKAQLRNAFAKLAGAFIVFVIFFESRRAEHRNAGPNEMQCSESLHHLPEHAPGEVDLITPTLWAVKVNVFFRRDNGIGNSHP